MAYLVCYTKKGKEFYSAVNNSMHLAVSFDNKNYTYLRNDTGILFPEATYDEGDFKGTTKTLVSPWLFELRGGGWGIACIRRNEHTPDSKNLGSIMIYQTKDFVDFKVMSFLPIAKKEVQSPRIFKTEGGYYVEWTQGLKRMCGYTKNFKAVYYVGKVSRDKSLKQAESEEMKCTPALLERTDIICGNKILISEDMAKDLIARYTVPENVGVKPIEITCNAGERPSELPKAEFIYSDGTSHEKNVVWDTSKIDWNKSGTYEIKGAVQQKKYPFPFRKEHMSDPCITKYDGKYVLTHTNDKSVVLKISETIDGLRMAEDKVVYTVADGYANIWAQELHVIKGVPYIFTTVAQKEWYKVRSYIFKCNGQIDKPEDWGKPFLVVKSNGEELNPKGISLDMTYFEDGGKHYVMWSNRVIYPLKKFQKKPDCEPADIYIATVNPDTPWVLTSEPVCVVRPRYGWDRLQTEVDEGPYILRRGDDIFITISGSSTEFCDLYCLGLLRAKSGEDLLNPENWQMLGYPVLTKESVNGQYGPGHNNFVKDENGDDLIVFHACPHDVFDKTMGRRMGIRRVHWGKYLPSFEVTYEKDVKEQFKTVTARVTIL